MSTTPLHVTVVDPVFDVAAGMWGSPAAGWQSPAFDWLGRLRALGVRCTALPALTGPAEGLVVVPDPGANDAVAARVLTGPAPDSGEQLLQLLAAELGAVVVPDLRGVLVLRLDDPGAAVKQHLRSWAHRPLTQQDWDALWRALEGFGRVSVFCCPGYVRDDGTVVDSRTQLPREWAALDDGVTRGLADLECHGWTHMHPDTGSWVAAPDRYDDVAWYRELHPPDVDVEPSVEAQAGRLAQWQDAVGATGTTVVAPGEAWGLNTLAAARDRGFALFNSWGVCFLDAPVPTWSVGIGSPYLDEADATWFGDCLPQVGYWHDRDMAVHGPAWIGERLAAWRDCGARRAWSFAELARAYTPIDAALVDGDVVIGSAPDVPLRVVRP